MKQSSIIILMFITPLLMAQTPQTYTDTKGRTHLTGPFDLEELETAPDFSQWYQENYDALTDVFGKETWAESLKGTTVEVFLGTWCGDSQYLVPRFVKLWDELGLDREQLNFVAVYGSDVKGKYKLSTDGEEQGRYIHRLPTIIINQNDRELGRIVESPAFDLNIDVAKIALGNPPGSNFLAATQLMRLLDQHSSDELKKHQTEWLAILKSMAQSEGELHSLARAYLLTDRMDEALLTLEWNTLLYPDSPKALKAYAKVLVRNGQREKAMALYRNVVKIDSDDNEAEIELQKLKKDK